MRSSIPPVTPADVASAPQDARGEQDRSPRPSAVGAVALLERAPGRARPARRRGRPTPQYVVPERGAFPQTEVHTAVTVDEALSQLQTIIDERVAAAGCAWEDRVSVAIATFLAALDSDPHRAWLCLMAPTGDSRRADDPRRRLQRSLVDLLASGAMVATDEDRSARATADGAVGSLWELAVRHVTRSEDQLGIDEIAQSVGFLAFSPRLGPATAMRRATGGPRPSELSVVWPDDEDHGADH
jgi:hypothetical protein